MLDFVFILLCMPILVGIYKRYVPVLCMSYFEKNDINKESEKVVLDIRTL
ncbi:hypothetical protein SAMN05216565_103271 [Litchfieldia salsa]|uniref:Uncharacterized protein n=1 Tax=Litchfieldia salsa TaxID=930152 RepID=A0A1H0T3G0_9BACI|nr:hypothetical protein SAMN05216565_103271 [Litchfieldia salsa]